MPHKTYQPFPGWRLSPDGKDYKLFENAEDVPEGWLRESPESFAKKGIGQEIRRGPGRPKKEAAEDVPLDL